MSPLALATDTSYLRPTKKTIDAIDFRTNSQRRRSCVASPGPCPVWTRLVPPLARARSAAARRPVARAVARRGSRRMSCGTSPTRCPRRAVPPSRRLFACALQGSVQALAMFGRSAEGVRAGVTTPARGSDHGSSLRRGGRSRGHLPGQGVGAWITSPATGSERGLPPRRGHRGDPDRDFVSGPSTLVVVNVSKHNNHGRIAILWSGTHYDLIILSDELQGALP